MGGFNIHSKDKNTCKANATTNYVVKVSVPPTYCPQYALIHKITASCYPCYPDDVATSQTNTYQII